MPLTTQRYCPSDVLSGFAHGQQVPGAHQQGLPRVLQLSTPGLVLPCFTSSHVCLRWRWFHLPCHPGAALSLISWNTRNHAGEPLAVIGGAATHPRLRGFVRRDQVQPPCTRLCRHSSSLPSFPFPPCPLNFFPPLHAISSTFQRVHGICLAVRKRVRSSEEDSCCSWSKNTCAGQEGRGAQTDARFV